MTTIKDIAKLAKVGTTTVSRVINKSPKVSELTKQRVEQAMKELNFVPNKNKLSFTILANNIFNTKTFKNYLVDDVSISKSEYRLLPRYILLKIEFRF